MAAMRFIPCKRIVLVLSYKHWEICDMPGNSQHSCCADCMLLVHSLVSVPVGGVVKQTSFSSHYTYPMPCTSEVSVTR